jgi:hypothetical protein
MQSSLIISKIQEQLSHFLSPIRIQKQEGLNHCLYEFRLQEVSKYNILGQVIKQTLDDLQNAI